MKIINLPALLGGFLLLFCTAVGNVFLLLYSLFVVCSLLICKSESLSLNLDDGLPFNPNPFSMPPIPLLLLCRIGHKDGKD